MVNLRLISITNTSDTTYMNKHAEKLLTNVNHTCQVNGSDGYHFVSCVSISQRG